MATILPLEPYIYSEEFLTRIADLIAPPYDVISDDLLKRLHEKDPHNITHLTLPDANDGDKYQVAGNRLRQWIDDGVLVRRRLSAMYPYTQEFTHPTTDQRIMRVGAIVSLHLEELESGVVLPHEKTLSGPRADRLRLMKTTGANLEPIFGMYPDEEQISLNSLRNYTSDREPLIRVEDSAGTIHSLWEATEPEFVRELQDAISQAPIFIVDGHHRYKTALDYRNQYRADHPGLPSDHPVDSIMIHLTPMSDSGLVILPTHRIVHSLSGFDAEAFIERIGESFDLITCERGEAGFKSLRQNDDGTSFLIMTPNRSVVAVFRPGSVEEFMKRWNESPVLAGLDVSILHHHVLEEILGISLKDQEEQKNLRYAKSVKDAVHALHEEETQLVIGMNPTRFDQVRAVALANEVMPQKSTYFYPKLASGLLVNVITEPEASS